MFTKKALFHHIYIACILLFVVNYKHVKCEQDNEKEKTEKRYHEAVALATNTFLSFLSLFDDCLATTMINQPFSSDNLQKFVVWPPRTTVGFVPKFTANRKFFANMISTAAFKEMLFKDDDELRIQHIHKMKYCDDAIMDANLLKEFYDREVDQSKI